MFFVGVKKIDEIPGQLENTYFIHGSSERKLFCPVNMPGSRSRKWSVVSLLLNFHAAWPPRIRFIHPQIHISMNLGPSIGVGRLATYSECR